MTIQMPQGLNSPVWPETPLPGWRPRIYFAGKIGKNDWRHRIVPNLRYAMYEEGPFDAGLYTYNGPFFVGCDHGCQHGPNTHGVLSVSGDFIDPCYEPSPATPPDRPEVARRALEGVRTADLMFVYVGAADCVGTIMEIGVAISLGIPVTLCIDARIDEDDFWLLAASPNVTQYPCITQGELPRLLASALRALPDPTRKKQAKTMPVGGVT